MRSFLSEYFSTVVLAPHGNRYRAAQVVGPGTHRGSGPREVHTTATRARAFEPNLEPAGSRVPHMSCSRVSEGS
jgi:hypothetical protein